MALIHLFDGINEKTSYTISGGKIKDHVNNIDWNNCVILRGGYRIDENYTALPNDIIYIRKTPAAATAAIIAGSIALVGTGVAVGVSMYNKRKALAAMEAAQKASKAAAEAVGKLPFVKGARNAAATGQTFPFAVGRSLMTPYRLCSPHYTILGDRGAEQYYNIVLEVGYNDVLIEKIKMGETCIKDFTGESYPQNGRYEFDAGLYYDSRNLIEIRQTGPFTESDFNKKIVLTEINAAIPHERATDSQEENERIEKEWKAGVVQELPNNAQSVELIVQFDGLQVYDNGWHEHTIKLKPQWTNTDNPDEEDWNDFTNGFEQGGVFSNDFTYNTKNEMRFVACQDFSAAQAYNKNIKVRIIRMTPKAEGSAKDTVYLVAAQTYCYDAKKSSSAELVPAEVLEPTERDKCCRIGLRIAANANTEGLLDAISVIECGCARTWDGTEWSEDRTPTENLAAWVLEILTNPHHRPSQYADEELDLETFGAWYEYCEAEGFTAGGVITQGARKKATLETLCRNGNAVLVYNSMTGKMEVAVDNGRDYSVALLNSDNIISISSTKEFKRKADGVKVKYINAAAGYDADAVTFMRDGEDYDPTEDTLTESALQFVTSYEHAFKIAWRQMAEESARPKIVTVKAGLESAYYPIFSRVELQHKSLKVGLSHAIINGMTWTNGQLKKIYLDGTVEFPAGKNCGIIINCVSDSGRGVLPLKVRGTGKTAELEILTPLYSTAEIKPEAGNSLSFGTLDDSGDFTNITETMLITNAEESDNGYTLTLVNYNHAIYEYGDLPTYRSNLTAAPNSSAQTIKGQREYVTPADMEASGTEAAQAAVDVVTKGTRFTNVYKLRPADMSLEDIIRKMDDEARNASASISISADEILLQVDDMARGLTGLIDVQAGAVSALVAGGGSSGQMSLSLNLPVMITAETRAKLEAASTAEKVAAVYARLEGSEYYAIKSDATDAAVKALWEDAVAGNLLASQIVLQADQIYIDGDVIVNDENKIKAALIDVEEIKATAGFFNDITITGTLNNVGGSFVGGLGKKTDIGQPWTTTAGYDYKPIGNLSLMVIQDRYSRYGEKITTLFIGMIQRYDGYDGTNPPYEAYNFTILQQADTLTLTPDKNGMVNIKVSLPSEPSYHHYYITELSLN